MPSRNQRRRRLMILAGVLVIAGATAALIIPRMWHPDFRTGLAKQLNVDPAFLHLNIPPAPNRLPGAAFVTRGPLLALVPSLERDLLTAGATFEMEWRELAKGDAQGRFSAGPLGGLFASATDDQFRIRLMNCRIFEASPDNLRRRLLESEDVRRQANAGFKPLVIVRSYEGQMELKVERGSKSDANVWADKVKQAKAAGGASADGKLKVTTADGNTLLIAWADPVVFAYEAAEARLFADHLGVEPNKVELTPVPESAAPAQGATSPAAAAVTPDSAASKKKD